MVIGRGVLVENTPKDTSEWVAQLPVAHAHTQGNHEGVKLLLYYYQKKPGMRRTYFRLKGPTRADVAQNILPVAPPQMRFELSPYTTLVRETVHQEMQSVKHNLIPLSETIFSIHKICILHIRLNNAYYFSTKRLKVRVKIFIHKVFWTFLEGTYFKILQARRHTYPSVTKLHKSTQLLTQSLMFFLTFRCSNLLRI
jgi:hypothetical protein